MGTPTRLENARRIASSVGRNVFLYVAVVLGVMAALWGVEVLSTTPLLRR